jgi:hypothetical protein
MHARNLVKSSRQRGAIKLEVCSGKLDLGCVVENKISSKLARIFQTFLKME